MRANEHAKQETVLSCICKMEARVPTWGTQVLKNLCTNPVAVYLLLGITATGVLRHAWKLRTDWHSNCSLAPKTKTISPSSAWLTFCFQPKKAHDTLALWCNMLINKDKYALYHIYLLGFFPCGRVGESYHYIGVFIRQIHHLVVWCCHICKYNLKADNNYHFSTIHTDDGLYQYCHIFFLRI